MTYSAALLFSALSGAHGAILERQKSPRAYSGHRARQSIATLSLLAPLCLAACGSKTGLLVPCRVDLQPIDPEIVFVLDASGSTMPSTLPDVLPTESWAWQETSAAVTALTASFDNTVPFGAIYFPLNGAGGSVLEECAVSSTLGVAPRLAAGADIRTYIDGAPAAGYSPLTPALNVVLEYARSHPTTRRRVVVLVTDGIAGCNADLSCDTCNCPTHDCCEVVPRSGRGCVDETGPVDKVASLYAAGAETAIVGVRPSAAADVILSESVLSRCAAAGRFGDVSWLAEGSVDSTLASVVSQARRSCQFRIPERNFGNRFVVSVGSHAVAEDAVNGWEWIDDNRSEIQLHGSSCETYRDSNGSRVSIAEFAAQHCE